MLFFLMFLKCVFFLLLVLEPETSRNNLERTSLTSLLTFFPDFLASLQKASPPSKKPNPNQKGSDDHGRPHVATWVPREVFTMFGLMQLAAELDNPFHDQGFGFDKARIA